jgi:DNA-directed RNA polymerase specialized sigma24 family protein
VTEAAGHAPARLRRHPAEKAALAVLPACGAAWTAAEILHATGCPWVDIGLGTAVAALGAAWKGYRGAAAWVLAGGAWMAASSRLGPLADPGLFCPATLTWAVLSFCGWRSARRHPAVIAARDRRNAHADWLDKRNRWGLPHTHLLDWHETRLGEWYLVDVRGTGKRASSFPGSDVAERIAEDLLLAPSRVRVRRHRVGPRIEISVRMADPWAKPIPHPVIQPVPAVDIDLYPELDLTRPYSITQPAIVGQDPETGHPMSVLLCGPHGGRNVNVVGTLDAGKTTLASCLSERVTAAPDALLFRINLSIKGDGERDLWGPACHLTAFGPREVGRARKVLAVLAGIIEWRAQQPKTAANWVPSPGDPHLVMIGDEIDALAEDPVCRRYQERLNSKGREFGYTSVRLGQRGTAEWTGGGNVRALDQVICLGRVERAMEAMHAAGDLGLQLPDMAEYGEGQPGVWAIADRAARAHMTGWGFNLSEPDDIRRIVAERAYQQPDLQPELKAFLGKSYEELLRTDVFARWAADRAAPRPADAHPRPDMEPDAFPAGLDPANPLHALAVLVRDGVVQADDETAETLAAALEIHEAEQASVAAWDQELNAVVPDELRTRWLKQGERLAEIRRDLAETAKMDIPDIPHEDQVAYAEAQWRALGEATAIPDDHRAPLLALLVAGTTISEVAATLGVSKWTARTYLERLRTEGLVRLEGERKAARWRLNEPGGGDTP